MALHMVERKRERQWRGKRGESYLDRKDEEKSRRTDI